MRRRPFSLFMSSRVVGGLALLTLVAAGCGEADVDPVDLESDRIAGAVLEAVADALGRPVTTTTTPAEEPDIDVPEGCVLVEEVDEYGFPIDVIRCDDDVPPPRPTGTDLSYAEWVGSDDAVALASAIRDALVLQTSCGDPSGLAELILLVAGSPDEVREPLQKAAAELAQAALFCNRDPEAWQDHMELATAYLEAFIVDASEVEDG